MNEPRDFGFHLLRLCGLLAIALHARAATAQCILPTVVSTSTTCNSISVYVNFTLCNASPPYAYAIFVNGIQYLDGGNDPCGFTHQVPWSGNVSVTSVDVTVFDNAGCNALGNWSGNIGRTQTGLTYSMTLDCATGLRTLRWTNANAACGSAGAHTATVDGNAAAVSTLFIQESPSVWRYNTALAAGPHTFGIDAIYGGPYPGYPCGNAVQCWATDPSGVVQIYAPYVQPGDCGVNVILKAGLQGPMQSGGTMSVALRNAGLLPLTEPYSALGYIYTGSPSLTPVPAAYFNPWSIVDWVVVELRSAANPATVLYSRPALIFNDGTIRDKNFFIPIPGSIDPNINFPMAVGNYNIAIRHRNHLGIMTAAPVALSDEPITLDFRQAATTTYGTNARVLSSGVWCMWAGDATGNGTVSYTGSNNDRDPILSAIGGVVPTNTVNNVYSRIDLNLDGTIKYTGTANDRDVILNTIGGVVPTNTRVQQLP